MDYAYKRVADGTFGEAVEALRQSVRDHGFDVRRVHDIQARLAAKGFPIRSLVIFEIEPGEDAANEDLALLMPLRVHVYEETGTVVVAALRPSLFSAVFPEHELDALAEQAELDVIGIVDGAVN